MITPLVVQALFGLVSPINKQALSFGPSALYVSLKLFLAAATLLLFHRWYKGKPIGISRAEMPLLAQTIITGAWGAHMLKYWGLGYMSASKMAFLFNASPLFVALFSFIRFDERLTAKQVVGLCITVLGLIPILLTTSVAEELIGGVATFSWPELAILCAAALHGFSITTKRILLHNEQYWPARIHGFYLLGGAGLSFMTWTFFGNAMPLENVPTLFGYALVTMIISKVICSTIILHLMKYYSTTFLAFMDYWYPLFVAFWSWLLWGECITYHYPLSAVIIFIGQYLFYSEELKCRSG
jgi:drug/metabolite transporter (DMT)-like permease